MTEKQKDDIARQMKSLHFKVKDEEKGIVTAVFSTFGVKDHDWDLTLPGAFEDGAEVLISAYGHKSWMGAKPVGKGVIHADEKEAWLEGQFFLDTIDGADTFKTIKGTGELQEWSYGFDVLETGEITEAMRQIGIMRVIKKARVYEVCPVMLGAGVNTRTLDVKERGEPEPDKPPVQPTPDPAVALAARELFAQHMKTRAVVAVR
jgi:HK97 family phage prohead protease